MVLLHTQSALLCVQDALLLSAMQNHPGCAPEPMLLHPGHEPEEHKALASVLAVAGKLPVATKCSACDNSEVPRWQQIY